jgi:hypothetical protein
VPEAVLRTAECLETRCRRGDGGADLAHSDFTARKWTQWGYPTWSQNGKFLYFDRTSTNTPGYSRVKIGQTHSEFLVDVKEVRRGIPSPLGPWATIAPDGSALFERDLSTSQIYALDLELP